MLPKGHAVIILRNRTTGKYTRRVETEFESGHSDSIDDVPPPGFKRNELTVAPPPKLAGVTPAQLEQSVRRGGPSTQAAHIGEVLDNKDP